MTLCLLLPALVGVVLTTEVINLAITSDVCEHHQTDANEECDKSHQFSLAQNLGFKIQAEIDSPAFSNPIALRHKNSTSSMP